MSESMMLREILQIVKANRADIIEMKADIKQLRADVEEVKKTVNLIMAAVESCYQTLLEILQACQGDGSGELVAALNALTKQIENLVVRVDDLPRAVADEVGV